MCRRESERLSTKETSTVVFIADLKRVRIPQLATTLALSCQLTMFCPCLVAVSLP